MHLECNPASKRLQAPARQEVAGFPHATRIDALYLHVPFCFHKCHYCDFYSLVEPEREDRQPAFVEALIAELRFHADRAPLRPSTIFVGGGTPTLLRPELWERLLAALRETGALDACREFTVEANPETVTPELMRLLAAGGVNRVSMGAQSFQPELLKALERWHDPASVARAVDITRGAGITNLNLDLIFAIPGQTLAQLDADLDAALSLEPTHLSVYNLTYEPNTALTRKLRLGRIRPLEDDLEAQMYERVLDRLEVAGFEHYEISNWARVQHPTPRIRGQEPATSDPEPRTPDLRCSHNLAYWRNLNWLALGPSASGHVDGYRWKNEAHLGRYLAGAPTPPRVDEERLDAAGRLGEALMLGLRLREGVDRAWLESALPPEDPRHETIDELVGLALLERRDAHLRLTRRGLFLADAVIARLL